MKKCILFLCLLSVSAFAQPQRLELKARQSFNKKDKDVTWETSYGSYNKTISQDSTVLVEIKNLSGATATNIRLDVYLINRVVNKGKTTRWIHERFNSFVAVPPRGTNLTFQTRPNIIQDDKYVALHEWKITGGQPEGLIVTLSRNGEILTTFTSSSLLDAVCKNPSAMKSLREKWRAEFVEKSGGEPLAKTIADNYDPDGW